MIELFIEGQRVDINESFPALMTFAIDDVKDFSSRNTSFSKTIILPGTKRNNYLFGNIFNHSSSSLYDQTKLNFGYNFNPAISAKCLMFNDNIQIFKGIVRLMQVNIDNDVIDYEVSVFGELGSLVAKLGAKKIEELDFSIYNHAYNDSNIVNSWNTINGSGYYYPLIDYGTYSTGKHNWKIGTFRPALFAKEYIDKIFSGVGFSYSSNIFNSTRFKNLIIPHNTKQLTSLVSRVLNLSISSGKTMINSGTFSTIAFSFDTNIGALFTANGAKTRFTYNGASPLTITLNWNSAGNYKTGSQTVTLSAQKNGLVISGSSQLISATGGTSTFWSWSKTVTISIVTNDYIEFFSAASSAFSGSEFFSASYFNAAADSATPILSPVSFGGTISINDTIPKNILQKDFLTWIVKLFNLYVYEDQFESNKLYIEPYVDFFSASTSIDWSLKLDRSKPIKITPLSELNSRYYEFIFKDDSDFYNDLYKKRYNLSYGSFKYDSQFEFINEVHKCEIGFSSTPLVGYQGEDKVFSTIFKSSNNVEELIDSNIRILQAKKITGVTSWNLTDASGSTYTSLTSYGYAGHLDSPDAPNNDLNFGLLEELFFTLVSGSLSANQFNLYWSSYMAEITNKDSKLLTAYFKLDYKDIYSIDFSKFIWIDGSLFRLNKITDFNASEKNVCEVQLLKIIEKIY
jgi:hypothetical protein